MLQIWIQPEVPKLLASSFQHLNVVRLHRIHDDCDLTWTMFFVQAACRLRKMYIEVSFELSIVYIRQRYSDIFTVENVCLLVHFARNNRMSLPVLEWKHCKDFSFSVFYFLSDDRAMFYNPKFIDVGDVKCVSGLH
jgi:hypothetical protein